MKIGLIGLNQTGKTTIFKLLTGYEDDAVSVTSKVSTNEGTGYVPDDRIDFLSELYHPKKTTYARIDLTDIAGFSASSDGRNSGASRFLNDVRPCDALVHVLRAFDSDMVIHDELVVDPVRDLEAVELEMLFADMELVEKRMERIKSGKKITKENAEELTRLERCYEWLEAGGAVRDIDLTAAERLAIKNYAFLTEKPRLAVVNLDESQLRKGDWYQQEALRDYCSLHGIPLLPLCAELELEISKLEAEDKLMFMQDLGINEPGISALAQAVYKLLGLISFITVGDDEVRAWTIEEGTAARAAAGKVHSDMERGFIRAEVAKSDHLIEYGSMAKLKERGLSKLEGKDYIVADGDVINFRFNV